MEQTACRLLRKEAGKIGLIRRLKRSNIVDYELTEPGQNFLILCDA